MIYISATTVTNVPFTLFEKTTLVNASYIMQLFSNQNHDNTYFWLTGDTTTNNARYNYFPVDLSPYNLIGGTYDYFVWQTTGTTLSTSGLTVNDVVESGLCTILVTGTTVTTFSDPKQEYTFE